MTKAELENLVKIGQLRREQPSRAEFSGILVSARKRLADAQNASLAAESRFDLTYGAAHGFALAALRQNGYRSENRYVVFQALTHTIGLNATVVRIFSKAHDVRNLAEYEGHTEVDEQLLKELIRYTNDLEKLVLKLEPPTK